MHKRVMRACGVALGMLLAIIMSGEIRAQQRVSMQEAVRVALAQGPRAALAGVDTLTARAELLSATLFPNPMLAAGYTKSPPQYHTSVEIPVDYFWLRGPRASAARAGLDAARFRAALQRAQLVFDVEVQYTRSLAGRDRWLLSRRIAIEGDSLLTMVRVRHAAGDASQLDVELALISAAQLHNTAIADSVSAISNLLDLQLLMGLAADRPVLVLTDPLRLPREDTLMRSMVALQVEAAQASLRAAQQRLTLQRRSLFATTSVNFGVETHDPSGSETGLLPTAGVTLPVPFFGGNRGEIAIARANVQRNEIQLAVAQREASAAVTRAARERTLAFERARRDEALTANAERVVSMARTAYREGAQALPFVLEMSRTAVEALRQYIDDLVAALEATAALTRALTVGGP